MRPAKFQRNALFEAVAAGGLDPRECTFDYDNTGGRVAYPASESSFVFSYQDGKYTSTALIGEETAWPTNSFSWTNVEERVRHWAEDVKRDADTPDLWGQLQREREIFLASLYEEEGGNTPFNSDEQAEIAEQLAQIKELLKEKHSLSEAQMLVLNTKIDDIAAAANRMGRKDWLLVFYGVMFPLVVTILLPPQVVHDVIVNVLHALEHLFGGWDGPPELPPFT